MIRDDQAVIEKGLRSGGLGYGMVLTSASWPKELPAGHLMLINQEWINRNVGRLYVHHPLKVYLLDSHGEEKFSALDWDIDVYGDQGERRELSKNERDSSYRRS